MSNIFISYVEEDAGIAREISSSLEAAGYSNWYYERDTVPGVSYLTQILQAIEQCQVVVLIVSLRSLTSEQVTKEVVSAFEKGRRIIPVLYNLTHLEFQQSQSEWQYALAGTSSIGIGAEGVCAIVPHIIEGLKALGIQPEGTAGRAPENVTTDKTHTSKHLTDKIIAVRPSIEGERKQVTVLFADVTGFTSMSEPLDPEEMQDLIRQCLDLITEEIHRYEGTVSELTRNSVMALFGAPVAHEDDPQRALYSALGIQERLNNYTDELKAKNIEFEARIGLNTGLVVVGRILDDLTMEYTPVGSTVDLASEMNRAAEPSSIQVTENAYRITRDYFDFKPISAVQIKGQKEPINTYQLICAKEVQTRFQASLGKGLTRFVGRDREIAALTVAFDNACSGSGQVVGIVGEAGVGKSRLLLELKGRLASKDHTYIEGSCSQYGGTVASYLPVLDAIRSFFDIREGDKESVVKDNIEQKITGLDERLKGILPTLHDILSLHVEDEEYIKLDAPIKRTKIFEAIRNLLIRESQENPLVIAIEDLHWIDKTSEEFLDYLIGFLANAHILLILLYRPEYTHKWGSKSYYNHINVDQLPLDTSAELVQSILEEGAVTPELRELILNRAAGNPLFMEEFTHTLVENGSIKKQDHQYVLTIKPFDIQVPDTIQGIIAARMDRLEESLKQTLQVAAVIGRDFAFRILQAIMGLQEELQSYLLNLQHQEFIYEKSLFPELEYIFKHALTQEVAYNSLLFKRRKEIHEKIGKAIEELYPDRLEEFYGMLAHHYSKSENLEKAYHYLKLSGDKASHNYSNWEALRFYREAINVLNQLPDNEENKNRGIDVRLVMDLPMIGLAYPDDSLQILHEGERLASELGDEKSLAKLHSMIGCCSITRGDLLYGLKYNELAFEEAERIGDVELVAPIAWDLCIAYTGPGESLRAAEAARKALHLVEETQTEYETFGRGFNIYSQLLGQYGFAMGQLGNIEEAVTACEKALRFALEINDQYVLGWIEYSYGWVCAIKGDGENAVRHFQNAIRYFEETQTFISLPFAWSGLGWGYYFLGDMETALKHTEKALEMQLEMAYPIGLSMQYYAVGMVQCNLGDLKNAQHNFEKALQLAQDNNEKMSEGMARALLGRILVKADISQASKAEALILQGINIMDELKLQPSVYQGYLYLAELYTDTGQGEKAQQIYRDLGMDF